MDGLSLDTPIESMMKTVNKIAINIVLVITSQTSSEDDPIIVFKG